MREKRGIRVMDPFFAPAKTVTYLVPRLYGAVVSSGNVTVALWTVAWDSGVPPRGVGVVLGMLPL